MIDDGLKWLCKSFIWSRGIVAAIVILAVLESVFGWDRVSFLEFTHTIISHWNVVTDHLFVWLTQWLPISAPETYARNLVMLGLVALGPTIAFLFSDGWFARRVPAKLMTVAGIIGYCVWLVGFWNMDVQIRADADLGLKIGAVLMLTVYPFGFSQSAFFGLQQTEFGRAQAKAMFAMFLFVLTLEVLYHFPKVKDAAADYVAYVNTISAESTRE